MCHAINAFVPGEPERVTRIKTRITSPVHPGSTLTTRLWEVKEGKLCSSNEPVIDLVVIAVLSVLCAFVHTPPMLVILRFLVGVAVGADDPIATSMIAEFSLRKYRAAAMGVIAAAWYLGANVAALVGFALINTAHGWRYMLASSAVPCILILLGRWNIPESPRWLVSKGRTEEAQRIVHETLGANVRLPKSEEAAPTSVRKVLRGVYLRRIVFIGVIWLCQAIPMFALYTYGPQTIGDVLAGIRAL